MHGFLDAILVGSAVLASVVYALVSLGPRALKPWMLALAALGLRSVFSARRAGDMIRRLQGATAKTGGGCGGCENCGSVPPPAGPGAAASEVRVSVSAIGRREESV